MAMTETSASFHRRKPARWLAALLILLGLIAALVVGAGAPANVCASEAPLQLKRGVSIHEWLNWAPVTESGAYRWPPYSDLSDWGSTRDFARIKALGFDFVRLSVDPGPLLASQGMRRDEALARLEQAVALVTQSGLKVIVDLHPVGQVQAWSPVALEVPADDPMAGRYRSVVASVAKMLERAGPNRVALELMNEPQYYPCDGSGGREWEAVLEGLVRAAREAAPDLTLVVSGACGGNITGLVQLDPAKLGDDRLLYSFHFYEPLDFTHQGVAEAGDVKGAPWPADAVAEPLALIYSKLLIGSDEGTAANSRAARLAEVRRYLDRYIASGADEAKLKARFDQVRAWARKHGVTADRLLLGEFSVMAANDRRGGALDADRYRWLSAVRHEAEALGAAWAYWEYSNPHGMSLTTADRSRRVDPIALKALGLATDTAALPSGN
jgi:endoglucanase